VQKTFLGPLALPGIKLSLIIVKSRCPLD